MIVDRLISLLDTRDTLLLQQTLALAGDLRPWAFFTMDTMAQGYT